MIYRLIDCLYDLIEIEINFIYFKIKEHKK
jgi:hypothetical protein